jgi:hypothetical protein
MNLKILIGKKIFNHHLRSVDVLNILTINFSRQLTDTKPSQIRLILYKKTFFKQETAN